MVNGCAGSRKTDTLIKLGIHHMEQYGHHIMFLTLVSSITHELKTRMTDMLGIDISRVGSSNHFIGEYKGCYVTIANFDAFVHKQLESAGIDPDLLQEYGDCHDWKTTKLLHLTRSGEHSSFVMKTGQLADMVLVDEFQDMDPNKARILTTILSHNKKLYGIAVGDIMQTIFPRAVSHGPHTDLALGHPMNIWKSQLHPTIYYVDLCYRCPPEHIAFVQTVLGHRYADFDVPVIRSAFEFRNASEPFGAHKPVLFCHEKISKNQSAYSIARQICAAVSILLKHDKDIKPDDVAVIMKKSNNSPVFEQLKVELQKLFQEWHQHNDADNDQPFVTHFETRGDGYHQSIDWTKAEGKAVLLSVHGDKGKGHKIVFFVGLSYKCLPSENSVFKPEELVDLSIVNVALTRSTKYLFVGFTLDAPSRYLIECGEDSLHQVAYTSWAPHDPQEEKTVYHECIDAMNKVLSEYRNDWASPRFDRELRTMPMSCPQKNILKIQEDVAKDMAHIFEQCLANPECKPQVSEFGSRVKLRGVGGMTAGFVNNTMKSRTTKKSTIVSTHHHYLLGTLGELLVYRHIHLQFQSLCSAEDPEHQASQMQHPQQKAGMFLRKTFSPILGDKRVIYTEDTRILNIVCDHGLNQYVRDYDVWASVVHAILSDGLYSRYLECNPEIKMFFSTLSQMDKAVYVLSNVFASRTFKRQLQSFLSNEPSTHIHTRVFWNVALCFNELFDSVRKPSVLVLFNSFNDDIRKLHQNVLSFCEQYIQPLFLPQVLPSTILLQSNHKLTTTEHNREILADRLGLVDHDDMDADKFARGYTYGILGRSDMIITNKTQEDKNILFEFKTSTRVETSREWVAQALLYCCVPAGIPAIKTFSVVNLLTGIMYTYNNIISPHRAPICQQDQDLTAKDLLQRIFADYGFQDWMTSELLAKL